MKDKEKKKLLDDFMSKRLSKKEAKAFEEQLQQDDSFAKETAERLVLEDEVRNQQRAELRTAYQQQRRRFFLMWLFVLLTLVGAVAIWFYAIQKNQPTVYATLEEIRASKDWTVSGDSDSWLSEFKNANYEAALEKGELKAEEIGGLEGYEEFAYVLGALHLYVESGNPNRAIELLQLANGYSRSNALLIEAYLNQNDYEKAQGIYQKDTSILLPPDVRSRLLEAQN